MMTPSPDYGDPILVPSCWYKQIDCSQVVYHAREYGYTGDLMPVVLRGALHCRMQKWRSPRDYGLVVIDRYIRRKRLTFVHFRPWQKWLEDVLFPMARKKRWWNMQRSIWDIQYRALSNEYTIYIDGSIALVFDPERMRNVKAIHAAIQRIDRATGQT
jgi:hypothetical protein